MIAADPAAVWHLLAARQAAAAEGSHLSQHIRWAGAIVAGAGAVEAVPELAAASWRGWRSRGRWLLEAVARFMALHGIPFPSWSRSPHVVRDGDGGAGLDKMSAGGRGWVFNPGTADERIAELQQAIIALDRSIGETQQMARDGTEALRAEMTAAIGRLETMIEKVKADHQEERRRGFVADARVIPVVVFGIVLTAIPDELAEVPVLAYLAMAAGAILALVVAASVLRDARRA